MRVSVVLLTVLPFAFGLNFGEIAYVGSQVPFGGTDGNTTVVVPPFSTRTWQTENVAPELIAMGPEALLVVASDDEMYTTASGQANPLPTGASATFMADVDVGKGVFYAVTENGQIWAWGEAGSAPGMAGLPSENPLVLSSAFGLYDMVEVAIWESYGVGLVDDGTVLAWNDTGDVGSVRQVSFPLSAGVIVNVDAGENHAVGVDENGEGWLWEPYWLFEDDLANATALPSVPGGWEKLVAGNAWTLGLSGNGVVYSRQEPSGSWVEVSFEGNPMSDVALSSTHGIAIDPELETTFLWTLGDVNATALGGVAVPGGAPPDKVIGSSTGLGVLAATCPVRCSSCIAVGLCVPAGSVSTTDESVAETGQFGIREISIGILVASCLCVAVGLSHNRGSVEGTMLVVQARVRDPSGRANKKYKVKHDAESAPDRGALGAFVDDEGSEEGAAEISGVKKSKKKNRPGQVPVFNPVVNPNQVGLPPPQRSKLLKRSAPRGGRKPMKAAAVDQITPPAPNPPPEQMMSIGGSSQMTSLGESFAPDPPRPGASGVMAEMSSQATSLGESFVSDPPPGRVNVNARPTAPVGGAVAVMGDIDDETSLGESFAPDPLPGFPGDPMMMSNDETSLGPSFASDPPHK